MRVVVVGSGVGGLVAGVRLAKAGHAVTILEQGPRVGGKLNIWEPDVPGVGKFRFDTGPHVLTMPWAIDELFADMGEQRENYLTLERVDPICRYHFADAPFFDALADPTRAAASIAARFPDDAKAFENYLAYAKRVHDVTVEPFLRQDFSAAIKGIPSPKQWKQLIDFLRLRPQRTISDMSRLHFHNKELRQIFDLYAFYNGSSPYKASAIFAIIAWVQWGDGTFYLRGGLRTYASALETLARKFGAEIVTDCTVREIAVADTGKKVEGVRTASGAFYKADAVICNADPLTAYNALVPPAFRPKEFTETKLSGVAPSTSAFLLLLGVEGTPARDFQHLSHYNSFLPADSDVEYKAIFEDNLPASDPVIGVTCQSVTDDTAAPPGHTNLFIMTSPPALSDKFAWIPENIAAYRARIFSLLATRGQLPDLEKRIVCEQLWTPETFATRYGAWRGSLYGASSNGLKSGFLRPPNRAKGLRGLYFVGGGTHPGGGLPLVTLGGKIVAGAVQEDFS